MALLNRFSKLNDRGETGIFTFIVTKSVTRDIHRDATTKDFCFGYHRWAISFQRPTDKVLGVHLLLRNASPSTACVVDFTLALLNREHFSQNQVYIKKQAKFTITNPMQGVSRWIELHELAERKFSNETGEFLFELSLSNMTTIFECDIQLNAQVLNQYKHMLKFGSNNYLSQTTATTTTSGDKQQQMDADKTSAITSSSDNKQHNNKSNHFTTSPNNQSIDHHLINLETNCFTFGSFDWSLTIVPLVVCATTPHEQLLAAATQQHSGRLEPVCRVYLNRLNGFDSLCRVKYRIILGHHTSGGGGQQQQQQQLEFVDSKQLDQISDRDGRIRGYQFRNTNILKLSSMRNTPTTAAAATSSQSSNNSNHHTKHNHSMSLLTQHHQQSSSTVDLRVHIEMFCANTISEAKVSPNLRPSNELQVSNCCDRNKQAWCVESDTESGDTIKLKLFFLDLQSVPRNHIRYISWTAYLVRRDPKSGQVRDTLAVQNAPHSNYYLQDGIDLGTIMDTSVHVKELNKMPKSLLDSNNMLTVHIEWADSLLLFSHLYNNYDALATIQRHQISRELFALQEEFDFLEDKYLQTQRALNRLTTTNNNNNNNGHRNELALNRHLNDANDDGDINDTEDDDDESQNRNNNKNTNGAANDDDDDNNNRTPSEDLMTASDDSTMATPIVVFKNNTKQQQQQHHEHENQMTNNHHAQQQLLFVHHAPGASGPRHAHNLHSSATSDLSPLKLTTEAANQQQRQTAAATDANERHVQQAHSGRRRLPPQPRVANYAQLAQLRHQSSRPDAVEQAWLQQQQQQQWQHHQADHYVVAPTYSNQLGADQMARLEPPNVSATSTSIGRALLTSSPIGGVASGAANFSLAFVNNNSLNSSNLSSTQATRSNTRLSQHQRAIHCSTSPVSGAYLAGNESGRSGSLSASPNELVGDNNSLTPSRPLYASAHTQHTSPPTHIQQHHQQQQHQHQFDLSHANNSLASRLASAMHFKSVDSSQQFVNKVPPGDTLQTMNTFEREVVVSVPATSNTTQVLPSVVGLSAPVSQYVAASGDERRISRDSNTASPNFWPDWPIE